MEQNYKHFDHNERTLIYWWRKEHQSLREMARRLRRSHSSISRELRRNLWCGQHYYPGEAQLPSLGSKFSFPHQPRISHSSPGQWRITKTDEGE